MLSLVAWSAAAIPLGVGLLAQNEPAVLREFATFLSVPNVAADPASVHQNAELVKDMLERRGVKTRLLDGEGGPPVVYGEKRVPDVRRTVVIYAHYDGQPVD